MYDSSYLEHYGVKGMKWGKVKRETKQTGGTHRNIESSKPSGSNRSMVSSSSSIAKTHTPSSMQSRKQSTQIELTRNKELRNKVLKSDSSGAVKLMNQKWAYNTKTGQNYYLQIDANGHATGFRSDGGYTSTEMRAMIDTYNEMVDDIDLESKKKLLDKKKETFTKTGANKIAELNGRVGKQSVKKLDGSANTEKGSSVINKALNKVKTVLKRFNR